MKFLKKHEKILTKPKDKYILTKTQIDQCLCNVSGCESCSHKFNNKTRTSICHSLGDKVGQAIEDSRWMEVPLTTEFYNKFASSLYYFEENSFSILDEFISNEDQGMLHFYVNRKLLKRSNKNMFHKDVLQPVVSEYFIISHSNHKKEKIRIGYILNEDKKKIINKSSTIFEMRKLI